jgi:prepilin-type N-terminal cleavage/methylation domain-containing protein
MVPTASPAAEMTLIIGRSNNPAPAEAVGGPVRRGGFTLLELIIVMGLVGMLLGLAAPAMRGFMSSRQTADAAAQVLALTQLASSRAAAQGTMYRLNVDVETKGYWLSMQKAGQFVDLDTDLGCRFTLPEGTAMRLVLPADKAARSYIEFYPNGRTEQATLELTGPRGEVYQVVCESATESFRVVTPLDANQS